MSRADKVKNMYEIYIENVRYKIDSAKESIEDIGIKIESIDLSNDDYYELDKLITKALIDLDNIE